MSPRRNSSSGGGRAEIPTFFCLCALSQADDEFFPRVSAEAFLGPFFFAREREKSLGVLFRLFWCFCAFRVGVFLFFTRSAIFFVGFFLWCFSNYFLC